MGMMLQEKSPEHPLRWIQLYFQPEGAKKPFQLCFFEVTTHGQLPDEGDKRMIDTKTAASSTRAIRKSGMILGLSVR